MIIGLQIILRFIFLPAFLIEVHLNTTHFFGLIFGMSLVTSAGYLINDKFDILTDSINHKLKLSAQSLNKKSVVKIYSILNLTGIFLGLYVGVVHSNYLTILSFIVVPFLLFIYAKYLKQQPLIGNLLVSCFIALNVILYLNLEIDLLDFNQLVVKLSWYFALMSLLLHLGRELIKDIEDIKGDYACQMNTLPICIGKNRTRNLVFILLLVLIGLSIMFFNLIFSEQSEILLYAYGLIILPNIILAWLTSQAKSKKSYSRLSSYFKFVSLLGMSLLLVF
ncbi:UbiA family prenyltransferase [Psychroflexus sp. ALD_RP9]|uniref:UbiA family prenyltransferase n=1 Tax=Psychroflexus sp. ALD_RP9 TaxID=2777186 RepID=UPI001A8D1231|nr:UbiA family prenyltransferase [Psychroflexus sp. ALD_RP9]QSS97414.1 UbiA family prenyltransferase [Psychroflexus sp. ALD_RP9]